MGLGVNSFCKNGGHSLPICKAHGKTSTFIERWGISYKRIVLLLLFLVVTLSSLFSTPLLWSWDNSDNTINYYRWQLGGEDDDKWTVVDKTTNSVTLDSNNTTLYLQASYDGIHWSGSTTGTYTEVEEEKNNSNDIGFVTVTWENDNNYNCYRYQRDSEDDNNWTVTEGKAESVVLPYHEGLNTYYVQSSYDGVLWSESAVTTYTHQKEKTKIPLSLRFNLAPYSSAVYYFYNGHDIDEARTLMGTIYGVSTSLELDYTPIDKLRLYLDTGYSLVLKIQTVIPKRRDVHYITSGIGIDYIVGVGERSDIFFGPLGGVMAHINNNKVSITPYYGVRAGFESRITESLTLGINVRVRGALLFTDNTLTDSLTLLIDPMTLSLTYVF